MTEEQLKLLIQQKYPRENEACEWKSFGNLKNSLVGKEKDDVASYASAISNMNGGHLVIGVEDKTLRITGTNPAPHTAESAKARLVESCTNLPSEGLEIAEFITDDTRKAVWVITIPKHSPRLPVIAHRKAWQRIGDSLVELTSERRAAILAEFIENDDWSARVIPEADISDLDPAAIAKARSMFKEKHPNRAEEVDSWDDTTFLNKANITIKGRITNTAVILLGKEESLHLLQPATCQIRWILKDGGTLNADHKIFSIPMITAIEEVGRAIRNTTYSYMAPGSMFPENMPRYAPFTLREPLNNAIAHQDYSKGARIEVVEYEGEKLVFRNHGQFIPRSVRDVVLQDCPESVYRNRFLVEAMRKINMVETEGGGIKKLFIQQQKRFFPLPEYDLSGGMVRCEIYGKVMDEEFAKILQGTPDLSLTDVMLLDSVQKHKPLTDEAIQYLRKRKLIEGRKPHLYLSSQLVQQTGHPELKADYIKNSSFDDDYARKLIVNYISKFGQANRKEIASLLNDKFPPSLSEKQKYTKVSNLISSLRMQQKIQRNEKGNWIL